MAIRAYDEMYVNRAAKIVGNMLHYAVTDFGYEGGDFLQQFIQSGIAKQIEVGNPKYAAGKSGFELFCEVVKLTEIREITEPPQSTYTRSEVYWVGWALAHCQWYFNRSFKDILQTVSYNDFILLYPTLHEADIAKLYDTVTLRLANEKSNLKRIRESRGMTQKELAERSGVSQNTIRSYEQKTKDINKAQIDILQSLAAALDCEVEDILTQNIFLH